MEWKLVTFQAAIAILSVIIILIALTSVVPALKGDIEIDIPEEEDIGWSFEGDELVVEASMWINNSGYYEIKDINIEIGLYGFNKTIFNDTKELEKVEPDEHREIPIELTKDIDFFTEEEKEKFLFNETEFRIKSNMKAIYPFSICGFYVDYDHLIEWEGVVETLKFDYDDADVEVNDDGSSMLDLPFYVETAPGLSGSSYVQITMLNASMYRYSTYNTSVPLGTYHRDDLQFMLDEDETEGFILHSQSLKFTAEIRMAEGATPFEYETTYEWGAPLNDLEITDITYDVTYNETTGQFEGEASGQLSFENDSPDKLYMTLILTAVNETEGRIGMNYYRFNVSSNSYFSEQISMNLLGVPDHVEAEFEESTTGIEYVKMIDTQSVSGV